MTDANNPVGVFDSGIGGLTVAHAIRKVLPNETIIYFGDTAHLPYGDKSEAAVQAYSVKIADVLLKEGCKVIVIACNSAASAAYELLKEYVGDRAKVINVIDPMIKHLITHYKGARVGLIGTKRTVISDVYGKKVSLYDSNIELIPLAAPLLVPMIEEGFFNNKVSYEIIENYLSYPAFRAISALILGCTHYPLIRNQIHDFFDGTVDMLDSSEITAACLKEFLTEARLLSTEHREDQFLVSDYTESFEASTRLFFRKKLRLQKYPL